MNDNIIKIVLSLMLVLGLVLLVAAENGVFDNTNYHEYNITNVSNAYLNKVCYNDNCSVYTTFNGSCINIVGLTSTLSVC